MTLTAQEEEWQRARRELYETLVRGGRAGLNSDSIRHARQYFISDGTKYVTKPYTFAAENDAVGLACLAVPTDFAKVTAAIGEELIALLPRETSTGHLKGYVNDVNRAHITLFHTSHPEELQPDAKLRQAQDIMILREMAAQFKPLVLKPHRVVLCSSGAIVLLYEVDETSDSDPFTIDRLREQAKVLFSPYPKRQSSTIMHTTLARVLDPDVPQEFVERIHQQCDIITERLHKERPSCVVTELWFVDETHNYSAEGPTTTIPLGGAK